MATDRLPPQNIDAEISVLGSLLIDSEAIIKIASFLRPDDFYRESHGLIYAAILRLFERREPADMVTVSDELDRHDQLEQVGGQAYLTSLISRVPTSVHIEHYARIVESTAVRRRLINAAGQIAALAHEEAEDVRTTIDEAERVLFQVSERQLSQDLTPIGRILSKYFDQIEYLYENQGEMTGTPTGFADLDKLLSGLQPSDLIIIAGRPGMGKTSLTLSLAQYMAVEHKKCVAIFTLEMAGEQLAQRMISSETGIDSQRLRVGEIRDDEIEQIARAIGLLSDTEIFIDDTPAISTMELRTKARRLATERDLDLVILDYMQLMRSGIRTDNRVQEISYISRALKALARELRVPVIAASQLSRAVESRQDKRPILSDLRESGCLTGESLVTLADSGARVPIRDLVGQSGFTVWALSEETFKLEPAEVSRAFSTGTKPVYRITTRLGRSICATANHKFRTINRWKRLDELEVGERIALPRSISTSSLASMSNVVSIEVEGEAEVYDLTVPGPHSFVANEIIVHNSIEQDADIVMFIYRDEVYNEHTDRPHVAEILVAKHRNGPTGKIDLAFMAEQAKFVNLYRAPAPVEV
ncbi:MAG: Replicative DNA helicase [Anaerolineales bacterium]|nr:Replicative DNA helicase [Anaerolineales bacterium]